MSSPKVCPSDPDGETACKEGPPTYDALRIRGLTAESSPAAEGAESEAKRQLRLPRLILAGGVGASLAVSGLTLQNLFINPFHEK